MNASLTAGYIVVGPLYGHRGRQILHLLDYYLWVHIKTTVYETKVESRAALRDRIFAAAEHIRNHPNNVASATQYLLMRAEKCIATGGHFVKQVLYFNTVM